MADESDEIKFERVIAEPGTCIIVGSGTFTVPSNGYYYFSMGSIDIMSESEWDALYKVGYGNRYYQEYSLDEKGYIYILTDPANPEWPTDIPFIMESKTRMRKEDCGVVYKFVLAV